MRIPLICPAPPGRSGNRVTARRWAGILRDLGHQAPILGELDGRRCAALIALHARHSSAAVALMRREQPDLPIIVAMTGTDLYRDLPGNRAAHRSLELATRLIVLQPRALERLPRSCRSKARVIIQSAVPCREPVGIHPDRFEVCVIGHLRAVKDPFRTAFAVRALPANSRIHVLHAGGAYTAALAQRARQLDQRCPRYRWLDEVSPRRVKRLLAGARLMVLSSKMEGGANVVCEALANNTPVLSSRIDGSIGLLGRDYPGYFEVGDTAQLTRLLQRAESDRRFYQRLKRACASRRHLIKPQAEVRAFKALLRELDGVR